MTMGVEMSSARAKLPIGIEHFPTLIQNGYYYVDKTGLIRELDEIGPGVALFTRPRRFGKSLNMSMLKSFFSYGADPKWFHGLGIEREPELISKYMGKFPVIAISLKGIDTSSFKNAAGSLAYAIGKEAGRFYDALLESERLTDYEKNSYRQLIRTDSNDVQNYAMSREILVNSLSVLTSLLHKHYGQRAVILLDEYDVPLQGAWQNHYYDEMLGLIRPLFTNALKSNEDLAFAILTGCLRVSKESVFTGLNNVDVFSVSDAAYDKWFGFTEEEVQNLLAYYDCEDQLETIRDWYDGYEFGEERIYCPWDVCSYVRDHRINPAAGPKAYWLGTSSNDTIRYFLNHTDGTKTREEVERLVAGETIQARLPYELTYRDLGGDISHLWSFLYHTGYLTKSGRIEDDVVPLRIPNREILEIFCKVIPQWFDAVMEKDAATRRQFYRALEEADARNLEVLLNRLLDRTISIRDTATRAPKENFYEEILIGMLASKEDWITQSNRESGDGYSDLQIRIPKQNIGILVELKYATDRSRMEELCRKALRQITEKNYQRELRRQGYERIIRYGICFHLKECRVLVETPHKGADEK